MANFFKPLTANNLVAAFTAFTFTTAVIVPPQVHAQQFNMSLNDINFGIKIEKIYEKVKKAIDRGETNKIVGYMFDFKTEVEQYTGKKIDVNKAIDQAEKEAKAKGQKLDSKHLKAIKKEFGKQDKKQKHRAVWFAKCAELDVPYTAIEADMAFEMDYMVMAKSAKGHDKEVQVEDVPVKVMVGVTVSLCGLFLWFVPLPGCQVAGTWLLNTGIGILGSEALDRYDAYDKDQRKKG